MLGRSAAGTWALGLLLALGTHAAAQEAPAPAADDQAYRTTIDEAVREFAGGHWEEARALFKRAHELSPNARTLRGMGKAAFELRMYVQAIRELDAALRDTRKPLDEAMRAEVQGLMQKANEFVGRVRLTLEPAGARLLVDGKEPQLEPDGTLLLDLGTHVFGATADGYKPTNLRLNIEGDSDQAVRIQLEPLLSGGPVGVPAIDPTKPPPLPEEPEVDAGPAPSPAPSKPVESNLDTFGWIAAGGAVAFGAAAGVFWAIGEGQYEDVSKECSPECTEQEIADSGVETSDLLTTVFLGVGAASAVTAIVLFALDASAESEASPGEASASVHVTPAGLLVRGSF
jgi:hypothetical protein